MFFLYKKMNDDEAFGIICKGLNDWDAFQLSDIFEKLGDKYSEEDDFFTMKQKTKILILALSLCLPREHIQDIIKQGAFFNGELSVKISLWSRLEIRCNNYEFRIIANWDPEEEDELNIIDLCVNEYQSNGDYDEIAYGLGEYNEKGHVRKDGMLLGEIADERKEIVKAIPLMPDLAKI